MPEPSERAREAARAWITAHMGEQISYVVEPDANVLRVKTLARALEEYGAAREQELQDLASKIGRIVPYVTATLPRVKDEMLSSGYGSVHVGRSRSSINQLESLERVAAAIRQRGESQA